MSARRTTTNRTATTSPAVKTRPAVRKRAAATATASAPRAAAVRTRAPRGNLVVGQAGGPTAVINQSLVGVLLEARRHAAFGRHFGARHGVRGLLGNDLLDLTAVSERRLEQVALTPGAALGSVRKKPTREECLAMFETFRKRDIRYVFYIGGNDSAETAHILMECAVQERHDLQVFHVPKTIDNDLRETDHCPGFGSAAKFVAQAFLGDDQDNRSLPGIKINIVMGRHAGFLTAASVLGRRERDDGPHLVYVPETVFDEQRFVTDVLAVQRRLGRCLVAVSEGIHDQAGRTVAESLAERAERDAHGNVQLSGSGALGDHLAGLIRAAAPGARVRADTFGYLQRSFAGCISDSDAREARAVGHHAVKSALRHASGSVVLRRAAGPRYRVTPDLVDLSRVARVTRSLDKAFIARAGNDITPAFVRYAAPLAGPLHPVARLPGV